MSARERETVEYEVRWLVRAYTAGGEAQRAEWFTRADVVADVERRLAEGWGTVAIEREEVKA